MQPDFEHLIRDLHVSLGLPVPKEMGEDGVRLAIGETEIQIMPHPFDARVIVRAEVGRLAADRYVRARQVEDLLRRHAGDILDFVATLGLDPESEDQLFVTATLRYGSGATAHLRVILEDVATLVSRYRPIVQPRTASRAQSRLDHDEPAMIFQP